MRAAAHSCSSRVAESASSRVGLRRGVTHSLALRSMDTESSIGADRPNDGLRLGHVSVSLILGGYFFQLEETPSGEGAEF